MLIPADNLSDLEELDQTVRAALLFIPVRNAAEVLREVLIPEASPAQNAAHHTTPAKQPIPLQDSVHAPITARQTNT